MLDWLQALGPFIAILGTGIITALSYYLTKKNQLRVEERNLKEKYYFDYIKALSKLAVSMDLETKKDFADKQNVLLLVGSSEVVLLVLELSNYLSSESKKKNDYDTNYQNIIVTNIVKAMRTDLYKNKKTNKNFPLTYLVATKYITEDKSSQKLDCI